MTETTNAPSTGKPSDSNLMGALAYLWILSVVMLLVKKDDPYVKFHAKQGLICFLAGILLTFIPVVGWLLNIVVLVFVIMGFVNAIGGKQVKLPLIGDLAEKINF